MGKIIWFFWAVFTSALFVVLGIGKILSCVDTKSSYSVYGAFIIAFLIYILWTMSYTLKSK
jgi:hypothetical protein